MVETLGGLETREPGKKVTFKWFMVEEYLWLGVPHLILAAPRSSPAGCKLGFSTLNTSIGINEKFALSLSGAEIYKITKEMWSAYAKVNPEALKELREIVTRLSKTQKKKTKKK